MVNDPIGDMLIQIKNASMAGRNVVTLPYSRLKYAVACIIQEEKYILHVEKDEKDISKPQLKIELRYVHNKSVITDLKRKSKPGLRLYVNKDEIPLVIGGMGIAILSTSKGIMTGKNAKKQSLGGELLCEIW
jgi:small subunit ribosomal protein S8